MAKLLIIVTNKTTYHAFWDSAVSFKVLSNTKNPLKYVEVGGDGAYLLAEFESNLSPQSERDRVDKRQTTHCVIALALRELAKSQERGAAPPAIYAAAHKPRVSWQTVVRNPRVGKLFVSYVDFNHGDDNPVFAALLPFVSSPTRETYDAVIRTLTERCAAGKSAEASDADTREKLYAHAFSNLKHKLVNGLLNVGINLQTLEDREFQPELRQRIAEKYARGGSLLLDELRRSIYEDDDGLLSVIRHVEDWAPEPKRQAVAAAWKEVEEFLPRHGPVTFVAAHGVPPGCITDLLSGIGDPEGLRRMRGTGGPKLFNGWYRALDSALDGVRKAIEAEDAEDTAAT